MIQLTHQRARDSGRCSGPKTEMKSAHVEIPIWDGLLLKTGKVEVDSKDKDGRTPLSWAAVKGHKAVVKPLLETDKVEVDIKDYGNRTPLFWAAYGGHEAVVKLLLETGKAEVHVVEYNGRTPLSVAANEAVLSLLLAHQVSRTREGEGEGNEL
jgi:hypothetical protein